MSHERVLPVQLDLLDWLAAQPSCPAPIEPRVDPAPASDRDASLLLVRVDPSRNMRRFYGVALATSLFGEPGVERTWGRIGSMGRRRTEWHATPDEAKAGMTRLAKGKRRRGYEEP